MFDVYDTTTQTRIREAIDLEAAAALLDVGDEDLEWAIEDCGRCDTDTLTAIPHGPLVRPGVWNPDAYEDDSDAY